MHTTSAVELGTKILNSIHTEFHYEEYKVTLRLRKVHGENEAAIGSNVYYTLSKYAMNSRTSIEWKIVITMQYCNRGKTQIFVHYDLLRFRRTWVYVLRYLGFMAVEANTKQGDVD